MKAEIAHTSNIWWQDPATGIYHADMYVFDVAEDASKVRPTHVSVCRAKEVGVGWNFDDVNYCRDTGKQLCQECLRLDGEK